MGNKRDVLEGFGFGPEDNGEYVDELRSLYETKHVKRGHVWWGPDAGKMTADERAKVLLDSEWQIARGHSIAIDHFGCRWNHFRCHLRRSIAAFRRWRDIYVLRLDPYDQRKKRR